MLTAFQVATLRAQLLEEQQKREAIESWLREVLRPKLAQMQAKIASNFPRASSICLTNFFLMILCLAIRSSLRSIIVVTYLLLVHMKQEIVVSGVWCVCVCVCGRRRVRRQVYHCVMLRVKKVRIHGFAERAQASWNK